MTKKQRIARKEALNNLNMKTLRDIAKGLEVAGRHKMKKDDLLDSIVDAEVAKEKLEKKNAKAQEKSVEETPKDIQEELEADDNSEAWESEESENAPIAVGLCKECMKYVDSSMRIEGRDFYECRECGYPNAVIDLFPLDTETEQIDDDSADYWNDGGDDDCELTEEQMNEIAIENDTAMDEEEKVEALAAIDVSGDRFERKKKYIDTAEPGLLVAFKFDIDGVEDIDTAKIMNRSTARRKLKVEKKNGEVLVIDFDDVIWVKTNNRWPTFIFKRLKAKKAAR